jgi:hypothetical protein
MKLNVGVRTTTWLSAGLLFLVSTVSGVADASADSRANVESYHYVEKVGEKQSDINWCLLKSTQNRLLYQSPDETCLTVTDAALNTLHWVDCRPDRGTRVQAVRRGDAITVTGELARGTINKTISIDKAPWFQATSLSMRRFVLSDAKALRFWTLRPDTMKAYKIAAVKKAHAVIEINDRREDAVMVELHLTGVLSAFWKSDYWFRQRDGLFLKFEGPSGPPGDPVLTIEFEGPSAPCDPSVITWLTGQGNDGAQYAGCQAGN